MRAGSRRDPALLGAIVVLWLLLAAVRALSAGRLLERAFVDEGRLHARAAARQPRRCQPPARLRQQPDPGRRGRRAGHRARLPVRPYRGARRARPALAHRCSTRRRCCRWSRRPSRPRSRSSSRSGPRASSPTTCSASPTSRAYGFWSTTLAETLTYFPIAYLTLRPILAAIDPNLEEMAFSLGGSRWRIFRTVTLPLAVPGFANAFLLLFAASLADFATPLILAGNSFPVLPTQAYLQITGLFDFKGGAVLSLMLLVPAAAVYPAAAPLGRPADLRHGHRQGRASARARAPSRRGPARLLVAGLRRGRGDHRLFLRPAALRLAGRGVRRQQQLHLAPLPRDLHRGPAGDPRHADHRRRSACRSAASTACWSAT